MTIPIFPDRAALVKEMNDARARGDEAYRARLNPHYERSQYHAEGWGSHIPLLASVVATARPGPVLEIGVGRSSSPLLVEMCRATGRGLVGLDSEQAWLDEIADIGYPKLVHMPDWSKLPDWLDATQWSHTWSVIFVDHGPGDARLPVLKMLRGLAEFIVCHDTRNEPYLPGFDAELDSYRYRFDYVKMTPSTTVVSDVRPYAGAK